MFHDSKLIDVYCNKKKMVICKMAAVPNGFINQLNLADHLHNIEKDVVDLKVNMTRLRQHLKESKTETSTTTL